MQLQELLARRPDLSTFLVHFTRDQADGAAAPDNLRSILESHRIEARSAMGMAHERLSAIDRAHPGLNSQHVVCFTETPMECLYLLVEDIDNRDYHFRPYGIAITKRVARVRGVNPVWYLDITPSGHNWLTNPINQLVEEAVALPPAEFAIQPIARLVPFFEQMGTRPGYYRKEFWWEREWRHTGEFLLPDEFIGFCPEGEINDFQTFASDHGRDVRFVDPLWSLERIIAHLAGIPPEDVNLV